jgi:hypothetical protein
MKIFHERALVDEVTKKALHWLQASPVAYLAGEEFVHLITYEWDLDN